MAYALQARLPLAVTRNRYWTGKDYSADHRKVIWFDDRGKAERWLRIHRYLRRHLTPVWVEIPQARAEDGRSAHESANTDITAPRTPERRAASCRSDLT